LFNLLTTKCLWGRNRESCRTLVINRSGMKVSLYRRSRSRGWYQALKPDAMNGGTDVLSSSPSLPIRPTQVDHACAVELPPHNTDEGMWGVWLGWWKWCHENHFRAQNEPKRRKSPPPPFATITTFSSHTTTTTTMRAPKSYSAPKNKKDSPRLPWSFMFRKTFTLRVGPTKTLF
jgi:hypothetical protein